MKLKAQFTTLKGPGAASLLLFLHEDEAGEGVFCVRFIIHNCSGHCSAEIAW